MKVTGTVQGLNELRKKSNSPVAFVPTMGALHDGHLSLVKAASADSGTTIVSIFVNPTQFNDRNDFRNYPRTIENDLEMLGRVLRDNDIVFTPEPAEIYPEEDKRRFSFGNLDNVMEASHRPGHFNGVAQVVSKLFSIVEPDTAFFGQKDFQQVAVIRELVRQMKSCVKIVSCPIIREADGLAMSSRNRLLEPEIRKAAPVIYRSLKEAAGMIGKHDIQEIKKHVERSINSTPGFSLEYFEIADNAELNLVSSSNELIPGRVYHGCIAVKAGNIRLIDNIQFTE